MMMSTEAMKSLLKERGKLVESYLATCLDGQEMPPRLRESMLYSLQAGGKRLRPVLCLSCAALCGLKPEDVLPFASAIEMVHTYSLIHDDLPAMDDDDLRRGKPSNHKAFDEATAILAGDALLTDAFAHMCRVELPAGQVLRAVAEFARAAGSSGMVGGQEWDMLYTGPAAREHGGAAPHACMKTGALRGPPACAVRCWPELPTSVRAHRPLRCRAGGGFPDRGRHHGRRFRHGHPGQARRQRCRTGQEHLSCAGGA